MTFLQKHITYFQAVKPTVLRPKDDYPSPYYQPPPSVTLVSPLSRLSVKNNKLKHLNTKNIEGNRMIHLCTLSNEMYKFNLAHNEESPGCIPYPFWPADYEKDWGVGVRAKTCCRTCGFEFDYIKLYEDLDDGKRGERMAKLNLMVVLYSLKTGTGYRELCLLFASLDCNFMSEHVFYRILNMITPLIGKVAEEAIENNRNIIKQIADHNPDMVGEDGMVLVPAQTDTVYNNPIRGHGYSSPGTQSVTAVMENVTRDKRIIAIQAFNQLCSKNNIGCKHTEKECGRNYEPTETIDSTERIASQKNYESLVESGIRVLRLCHDSVQSSRHLRGMRDVAERLGQPAPVSSPCTAHMKRNTTKQVHKIKFSPEAMQGCPKDQQIKRATAIGCWFSDRISVEMILAFVKYGANTEKFVAHGMHARTAIIPCAMGFHGLCQKYSLICKQDAMGLPGNQYLKLTINDQTQIWQFIIQYRMSEERLRLQQFMETTNRAESYNRTTLTTCPKSKTFRRNYVTRALSAAHTDSVGILDAMMEVTHRAGAPITVGGRAHAMLTKLQKRDDYQKKRRRTLTHKKRVQKLRFGRAWMKAFRKHSLKSGVETPDHSYPVRNGGAVV